MLSLLNSLTRRCFPFTNMSPTQSNGALTRIQFGEDKNHFYTYAILRFQAHSYELLKILSLGCQPLGRRDQSPVSPWDPLTLTELQIPPAVGAWRETKCLFTEKKTAVFNVHRSIPLLHLEDIVFYCLFANILRTYKLGSMFILHVLDHFENCM